MHIMPNKKFFTRIIIDRQQHREFLILISIIIFTVEFRTQSFAYLNFIVFRNSTVSLIVKSMQIRA